MAIDARIPLAGRFPDFGKTFRNALITGQQFREAYDTKDVRKQLMEQRAKIQETALSNNAEDRKRMEVLGTLKALRQMDPAKRDLLAPSLENSLKQRGFMGEEDSFLDDPYQDDAWLDASITALEGANRSNDPAEVRAFQSMTGGLSPEDREKARRIALGLDPRAGTSAQERIATTPGMTGAVAASEGVIAGSKSGASESAKLAAQMKQKPEVEAAVRDAVLAVEDQFEQDALSRDNQKALAVYDAAMSGLVVGLGGTTTGPGVGWMPAMTANAQIAEGAISAMAPVLKQIFRASGEGIFTDKDQALLMEMLPDRNDLPEARISKFKNVDAIVRAKLMGEPGGVPINPTKEEFDALPSGAMYIWEMVPKRKP